MSSEPLGRSFVCYMTGCCRVFDSYQALRRHRKRCRSTTVGIIPMVEDKTKISANTNLTGGSKSTRSSLAVVTSECGDKAPGLSSASSQGEAAAVSPAVGLVEGKRAKHRGEHRTRCRTKQTPRKHKSPKTPAYVLVSDADSDVEPSAAASLDIETVRRDLEMSSNSSSDSSDVEIVEPPNVPLQPLRTQPAGMGLKSPPLTPSHVEKMQARQSISGRSRRRRDSERLKSIPAFKPSEFIKKSKVTSPLSAMVVRRLSTVRSVNFDDPPLHEPPPVSISTVCELVAQKPTATADELLRDIRKRQKLTPAAVRHSRHIIMAVQAGWEAGRRSGPMDHSESQEKN